MRQLRIIQAPTPLREHQKDIQNRILTIIIIQLMNLFGKPEDYIENIGKDNYDSEAGESEMLVFPMMN